MRSRGRTRLNWASPAKPIGRRSVERRTPITSIYDGRHLVGFVLARGRRGFEAFTAAETSLGCSRRGMRPLGGVSNETEVNDEQSGF